MWKYVAKRILHMIPVLIGVTFVVFTLLYLTPGDPAKIILGESATVETIRELRGEMGLDDPFLLQFWRYLKNAATGNIGRSYMTGAPVAHEIMAAFPSTLKLGFLSIFIAIFVGIPLGIISAVRQYSVLDTAAMFFALVGISMPVFWLGLLLILFFSVYLGWFPASGFDTFRAMILPAIALSTASIAMISRMTRSSMLEVIHSDYIRTVRAKGQKERIIVWRHALGNALIPIVTIAGLQFGQLLEGAVLTETIFSIPGVGRLMVDAIKSRDYPMVQGGILYMALAFTVVNLIVDLLYACVDPRIRAQYRGRGK